MAETADRQTDDMGMPSARVTGLLLAAGGGRRFGMPKALVDDGDGPWVLRAVQVLLDGGCGDVLVVTGAAAEEVEALVDGLGDPRVTATRCGTWEQGMGESLRAGLTALATRGRQVPTQALVHLVDLPDVGAVVAHRILGDTVERGSLRRAVYDGVVGHPALIGRDHWAPLVAELAGDRGAGAYLRRHSAQEIDCSDLATGVDVDAPDTTR